MISNLMVYSLRFEVQSATANNASPSVSNGFLCVPGQVPSRRGSDQSRYHTIQYFIRRLIIKIVTNHMQRRPLNRSAVLLRTLPGDT